MGPSILNLLNCSHSIEELKISLLKKNNDNLDVINVNIDSSDNLEIPTEKNFDKSIIKSNEVLTLKKKQHVSL